MSANLDSSNLSIPATAALKNPTIAFFYSYAKRCGLSNEKNKILNKSLELLLNIIIGKNQAQVYEDSIDIDIYHSDEKVTVKLVNKGEPIFLELDSNKLSKISEGVDGFLYENNGRNGQSIFLEMNLLKKKDFNKIEKPAGQILNGDEFEIRSLLPGEEGKLSRLFFQVYGYNYINDYVYYPNKLKEMIGEGDLIPTVAVLPDGQLIGHVALVKQNDTPMVYEAALGVVDPRVKSKGMFSKLFQRTMEIADKISMQYCLYDIVTNHEYSQKQVSKYDSCEMSIQIGSQLSETQAKLDKLGIGDDPEDMDRYSLLVSIKPQVEYPFGKTVTLPAHMGELADFILKPLGINWVPASRFYPLMSKGDYRVNLIQTQKAVFFDFVRPGERAIKEIISEWNYLLKIGYKYAAVDIPLDYPGIGQLYDLFARNNFFISGFIPYQMSDRLGMRLQSIGPTRVAFDQIKVYSPTAKKLLALIHLNYERNCL